MNIPVRIPSRSGLAGWIAFCLAGAASAQTYPVVLDNFEVDPYVHQNPNGTETIVSFPPTTNPPAATTQGWEWTYVGYGTPASGLRDTTTFQEGVASWHFHLPEASNLDDPNTGSDNLSNAGPIVITIFKSGSFEPRTIDQIISDLGQPKIDWNQLVRFDVQVRAKWGEAGGLVGTFSEIRQGILIFSYSGGGAVQTPVNDFTYAPGNNDDGWHTASIDVLGKDGDDSFVFGLFGAADFTAQTTPTLVDRSPELDLYFDRLRVVYSPLRLENVVISSPIDENDIATLSGDIPYANAATSFHIDVDWGDGSPVETFTYPTGTKDFEETHRYLDDDPTATPADVYPVTVTLTDDEGSGEADTSVTVDNVAPILSGLSAVADGPTVTLSGSITDPGTLDTFSLQVDWGDAIEMFSLPAGTTSFSEQHTYADHATNTILLTLVDDDLGTAEAQVGIAWAIPSLSRTGWWLLTALLAALGALAVRRSS